MNIYEVNKIMSCKSKSRIVTHFFTCTCKDHDVNHMCRKINISQPNMSKHLAQLIKYGVLNVETKGRERYYEINQEWKKQWSHIISPQLNEAENKEYVCSCSLKRNENVKSKI